MNNLTSTQQKCFDMLNSVFTTNNSMHNYSMARKLYKHKWDNSTARAFYLSGMERSMKARADIFSYFIKNNDAKYWFLK